MIKLDAHTRDIAKKNARILRREGFIPAEVYGHNFNNLHVAVPLKEFLKTLKDAGESGIVSLKIDKKEIPVLIQEVVWDSVSQKPSCIDFHAVKMDEKIEASVPLRFMGEAPAVKEKNGVLVKVLQEIDVEALPADLPREINVSIAALKDIGASIHIKDLPVSEKVKILQDGGMVIITVSEAREEEEVPQGPTSVEDVEVESKGKQEAEGEKADVRADTSGAKPPGTKPTRDKPAGAKPRA